MIAIVTLLAAFPLGFLLRNRLAAFVAFLASYLYAFTFQTGYLTRAWAQGDDSAFPRRADLGLGYLAATSAILAVGCALVVLGHHLGTRRRGRADSADLDPAQHQSSRSPVMSRFPLALAGAAATLAALAACSTTPAAAPAPAPASAAPSRDTATACSALVTLDAAVITYPGADPDSPPPSADALKQWTTTVEPPFGIVAANVPAELESPVATLRTALDGTAKGTPLGSSDATVTAAASALDKWGHDTCGYTRLDVTGNGTDLPGAPATLPAGPLSISFDNGGDPAKGGFVLLLAKVKDGKTFTIDGIRNGSVDFSSVADVVAAVQPTQGTAYSSAKLDKGRYLLVSPIGAPPNFTGTVAEELAVS